MTLSLHYSPGMGGGASAFLLSWALRFKPMGQGGVLLSGFNAYLYVSHTLRVEIKCALAGDACLGMGV
jgi:hypothetical protein